MISYVCSCGYQFKYEDGCGSGEICNTCGNKTCERCYKFCQYKDCYMILCSNHSKACPICDEIYCSLHACTCDIKSNESVISNDKNRLDKELYERIEYCISCIINQRSVFYEQKLELFSDTISNICKNIQYIKQYIYDFNRLLYKLSNIQKTYFIKESWDKFEWNNEWLFIINNLSKLS